MRLLHFILLLFIAFSFSCKKENKEAPVAHILFSTSWKVVDEYFDGKSDRIYFKMGNIIKIDPDKVTFQINGESPSEIVRKAFFNNQDIVYVYEADNDRFLLKFKVDQITTNSLMIKVQYEDNQNYDYGEYKFEAVK